MDSDTSKPEVSTGADLKRMLLIGVVAFASVALIAFMLVAATAMSVAATQPGLGMAINSLALRMSEITPGDSGSPTGEGVASTAAVPEDQSESPSKDSGDSANVPSLPVAPTTSAPADPNAGKTWHPGWEERVLVSNAWTEYVYHPAAYSTIHHPETGHPGSKCNQCGMEITGFASQHLLDRMPNCWSYANGFFIDSPAWDEQVMVSGEWTEEVYHPAEYRTVYHEGYWE